ncbi:MAG TPA: phage holin family protein [Chitinispirillaceae bacterium]|nr:phage holin family protein [Chitinispirillaceae bacterium]
MVHTLLNIAVMAGLIYLIDQILPAVHIKKPSTAIWVAVIYSLLNFFLGWLFVFLTFPIVFLTMGLFKFVINAFFLWITDKLIEDFRIDGFGWTLVTALLISVGSSAVHAILRF